MDVDCLLACKSVDFVVDLAREAEEERHHSGRPSFGCGHDCLLPVDFLGRCLCGLSYFEVLTLSSRHFLVLFKKSSRMWIGIS